MAATTRQTMFDWGARPGNDGSMGTLLSARNP